MAAAAWEATMTVAGALGAIAMVGAVIGGVLLAIAWVQQQQTTFRVVVFCIGLVVAFWLFVFALVMGRSS